MLSMRRCARVFGLGMLLAAPAMAQINLDREVIAPTRPEVTHHVTATKTVTYWGEIWYEFDLASIGDVPANNRYSEPLPDGRRSLDGAVVQIHGVDGFPPGSTWQDYVVRTDLAWFSTYDWVFAENPTSAPRPEESVYTNLTPHLLAFDVRHYHESPYGFGTGIGLPLYGVSFGLGWQTLSPLATWDGALDWGGPSGTWSGEVNNTNPTADDQEMSNDWWTARKLWAEYGNLPNTEVPLYWVPIANWGWTPEFDRDCRYTLPSPGCIGCNPQPMDKEVGCSGHGALWPYGELMHMRGTGGPTGGGWRFRIRVVDATTLPLEMDHDAPSILETRTLLAKALLGSPRQDWPKLIQRQREIVSVDRTERVDLRTGEQKVGVLVGYRLEVPEAPR